MVITGSFTYCNKYMDIVPDNVPELSNAFSSRVMAERYLATCYSWLPGGFDLESNPALFAGDELWLNSTYDQSNGFNNWRIAKGDQNSNSPLNNYWDGANQAKNLWRGIRDCNVFLENVVKVPDMDALEIKRWVAEVTFLKAYYHYYLMRLYGPVLIQDTNLPVTVDPMETQQERVPIDECVAYIVGLIDGVMADLPDDILVPTENGRISKLVALSMKAEILVTVASPLFNGNPDYTGFVNSKGQPFFNPVASKEKWVAAAEACKVAVELAELTGRSLFKWQAPANMTVAPQPTTINQMSYREGLTERQNNTEQIWVNNTSRATAGFQSAATVRSYDPAFVDNSSLGGYLAPTLNMALLFHSKNGVPIEEDLDYEYGNRFSLRVVPNTAEYKYKLTANYTTIGLHFDREDRFYGALSFDGGRYFMSSLANDDLAFNTNYKPGGNAAPVSTSGFSATGYTPKKLVSYRNVTGASNAYTVYEYAYPMIRLADLYLLYAEALNEAYGPGDDAYKFVDLVRERSGLAGVVTSWAQHSRNPAKPTTYLGLQEIIRRERSIELMFEGKRFWDLRRWKTAQQALNANITGWSVKQGDVQLFYRQVNLFSRTFSVRDYLWPLSLGEMRRNSKLVQNPGW